MRTFQNPHIPLLSSLSACLLLLAGACATGSEEGPSSAEGASGSDWSSFGDGGAGDPDDPCLGGEHLCDGVCVPDQANDPDLGCAAGCGEPCEAPEGATATCSLDGRCDFECGGAGERVGFGCECVPLTCEAAEAECGEVDDGCGGVLDCGECAAACEPDGAEDNEVQAQAHSLGELTDAPRTDMLLDTYALQSRTDVDWYRAVVRDGWDGTNPTMEVTLADAAPGYHLGAWFVCDSGGDFTTCETGTADNRAGRGCVATTDGTGAITLELQASCTGINEHGVLIVRVLAETEIEACIPYTLGITVD